MASLRLDGVAKRFADGTDAVRPLDLTVPDGEFLVVMGPSGCGKSTLLRVIAGLEDPTAGRVWLGGNDVTTAAPAQRDVAMVFQAYALYPHMTVAENLAFGLRMRRVPRRARATQVAQVAEQLGLTPLLERLPKALSGGEQQRVALGRALIRRPKLFLLDEPLSNLDVSLRAALRDDIRRLHAETGITTVYVTHDQHEALALAQRLAVMHAGTLLQVGAPDVLYDSPKALPVARALGQPAINCVKGIPRVADGVPCLEADAGTLPLPTWCATTTLPESLVFGVRPEHLTLGAPAGTRTATLAAHVDRVEGAGPDRVVWVRWGPLRLAARLEAAVPTPTPDKATPLTVDLDAVLLFDAATGLLLEPPGA